MREREIQSRLLRRGEQDYMIVKIEQTEDAKDLPIPQRQTKDSVGYDLYANIPYQVDIEPRGHRVFGTGIKVAVPEGYELQVRGRSGLAFNHKISILHGVGTVDTDYRGEVKVILHNKGAKPYTIQRGDRIAQAIFAPVLLPTLEVVPELDTTERGEKGFGSTDIPPSFNTEESRKHLCELLGMPSIIFDLERPKNLSSTLKSCNILDRRLNVDYEDYFGALENLVYELDGISFMNDISKMLEFSRLTRKEFLDLYPGVTEENYEATLHLYILNYCVYYE